MNIPEEALVFLRALLEERPTLSEYEFIRALRQQSFHKKSQSNDYNLALFHEHFIARHIMYRVEETRSPGVLYSIDTFGIKRIEKNDLQEGMQLSVEVNPSLKDYYLDLNNLDQTSKEDVQALLDGFWKRYSRYNGGAENLDQHFETLDLQPKQNNENQADTWRRVQKAYRLKIQSLHPDKGGDAQGFNEVREAYEALKSYYEATL